jgi:hypothetical protein
MEVVQSKPAMISLPATSKHYQHAHIPKSSPLYPLSAGSLMVVPGGAEPKLVQYCKSPHSVPMYYLEDNLSKSRTCPWPSPSLAFQSWNSMLSVK